MSQARITIDGDTAVLENGAEPDSEWLQSDAVVSLDDWV